MNRGFPFPAKPWVGEFFRYAISGGIAFLVDFAVLFVCVEHVFGQRGGPFLYISAVIAFMAGFTVNYLLSVFFVFTGNLLPGHSFFVFIGIAAAGLGLTELGMYIGVSLLALNYMLVKVVVSGLVLIWNYGGRKFFLQLKGAS